MAVKIEKFSIGKFLTEIEILQTTQRENCKHFCRIHDHGTVRSEFNYIVMSLLGKDLYRLRSEMPRRSFSINTTTKIALETLEAIEELHSIGYINRDIQPINFAPGLSDLKEHKTIFMFDFGSARKYADAEDRKWKSRGEVGRKETVRYASLNAHKQLDLGRRDDLESWFYMIIEMYVGELPWDKLVDEDAVEKSKITLRIQNRNKFFSQLPTQFETILKIIDGYTFEIRPEYRKMKRLMNEIRVENGCSDIIQWDWEKDEVESVMAEKVAAAMP